MTEKILKIIGENYPLAELSASPYETLKANGMKFAIKVYSAEGLGHISVMKADGFLGLMKMDTLIVNPKNADLPLYSYDRILAMGNDTLIVELYDTLAQSQDLTALSLVKEKYVSYPDHPLGEHWYDPIKLSESISKKGKKRDSESFDSLTIEHLNAYLAAAVAADEDGQAIKQKKASDYVNGLLKNGGPATDVFKKSLGEEKTAELLERILFGVR